MGMKPTKLQADLLRIMAGADNPPLVMRWRAKYYAHDAEVYYGSLSGYRKTIRSRTFEAMLEAGWIEPNYLPGEKTRGASYYRLTVHGRNTHHGRQG